MVAVVAEGVAYAHAEGSWLFSEVSVRAGGGWTGVVGENGAGKTTLLRVLSGELAPGAGRVRAEPAGARVLHCPQSVESPGEAVLAFGRDGGGGARALRGRLGLSPAEISRWETLSPGERRRWQVGAALWLEPDVLLLDEPTNHLDGPARAGLLAALRSFRGAGVIVSHDREALDALCGQTLRLHRGRAEVYPGGYARARAAWEADEAAARAAYGAAREDERRARARLADARRDLGAAERSRSAGARMRNAGDRDATSILAQGRADAGAARQAQSVAVARRALARAERARAGFEFEKNPGRAVVLAGGRAPSPWPLALEGGPLRAGGRVVVRDARVAVGRADRVRVAGPNGAGKSTLLGALARSARVPSDRLLHLPQEVDAARRAELLRRALARPPEARARCLSLLAALGAEPEALLRSRAPSPGEVRKLLLADALAAEPWVLLLDEPTNHLDLPSVERMEAALAAFPGALVLATHDEAFARACGVRTVLRLAGGEIVSEAAE